MRLYRFTLYLLISVFVFAAPALAQLASNSTVKGAYFVRYVGVNTDPSDVPLSFMGTFTFDGSGKYTATGSQTNLKGSSSSTTNVSLSGTYNVLSSGILTISNPFDTTGNTILFGGVGANSVVIASSTDTFFCDLFVAVPSGTGLSNSTLSGNYYLASFEFLNGDFNSTRQTFSSIAPNGSGSFGNVTISGTAINLNNAATTQNVVGGSYSVTGNGSGTLTLPAPSGVSANNVLLSGSKTLYVSPDGSFFIAGSSGYDMIIGMKAISNASNANASGLFFTALLENYHAGTSADGIYASQGASNLLGNSQIELAHERLNPDGFASYDSTFLNSYNVSSNGTISYTNYAYAIGGGGNIILGTGISSDYIINVYVKLPTFTGSGVFLDPSAVVNAANSMPFTAQVSPGEVISLFGSGFTTQNLTTPGLPFPPSLGGASVTASWTNSSNQQMTAPCPLYFVSANQINAVVPYNIPTDGSYVTFTVTNGTTTSNGATLYSGLTQPGMFTCSTTSTTNCLASGGIGFGAILHPGDFSLVTSANPAKPGETVQMFLTGLGTVTPAVAAGSAGPTNPFSTVDNGVDVYIDGFKANKAGDYQGLAPTLGGLYQINVTIPTNVTRGGPVTLEISTVDADNIQATIPISK